VKQIWCLARDGKAQRQITREVAAVESFDVLPVDGALVYVTHNTLIHSDALGEYRHVLPVRSLGKCRSHLLY
jgi:hypothetical protein